MRAFTIKHKGITAWYNMAFDRVMTFSDDSKVSCGFLFYKKKDAKKYLETFPYKESYEVVGVTIDKSKKQKP